MRSYRQSRGFAEIFGGGNKMKNILTFIIKAIVILMFSPVIICAIFTQLLGTFGDLAADIAFNLNYFLEDIAYRYFKWWSDKLFEEKK